jgi:SAM-dependent MidA family methyltransferase
MWQATRRSGMVGAVGTGLGARIAERARRFGSLPWSAFMEAALYDPEEGFYQAGGRAGRSGDFVTSPELGSLFAAAMAHTLDACWEELGRPDPFVVVEAAAGTGTLARDILSAHPACGPALRYVLVEQSAPLRAAQATHLPIELPALVLGPVASPATDGDDDDARSQPGIGPLVTALADLPAVPVVGVVLANELLDNLPVDLLEFRAGRWHEVRVAAPDSGRDELVEMLVPVAEQVAAAADRLAGGLVPEGARIPLEAAAAEWLRLALATVAEGRVILIDYFDTTAALARRPWREWLRTFRHHQPALFPLAAPGTQDITCVVAGDQLAAVRPPDDDRSQAEWLAVQGTDRLVAAARDTWWERAAIGDLAALKARSRVHEGEALADPAGLGGHRVLQWIVGARA